MDLLEDEPAAGGEDPHLLSDVRADLLGCAVGQNFPGVAAATPECQVPAELALQLRGAHPAAGDLDRVDGVEPRVDEVRQKRADPSAAMQHDPGQFLGTLPHRGMAGLEELAVHRRRHLGAGLHAQVIAEEDDVDVRTDSAKEPLQVRQMVLGTLIVVRVVVRAKSPSGRILPREVETAKNVDRNSLLEEFQRDLDELPGTTTNLLRSAGAVAVRANREQLRQIIRHPLVRAVRSNRRLKPGNVAG